MGIYANERWVKRTDGLVEYYYDGGFGIETVTVFTPIAAFENRVACYCCTCGEREGSDAACRNHGWAAVRPCLFHDMPGSEWDEEVGDAGQMPMSVEWMMGATIEPPITEAEMLAERQRSHTELEARLEAQRPQRNR